MFVCAGFSEIALTATNGWVSSTSNYASSIFLLRLTVKVIIQI